MSPDSPESIQQQVEQVGRAVHRWRMLFAASLAVAAVLAAMLLVGTIDYLLRVEEVGARVLGGTVVLATAAAAFFFLLRPAWNSQPSLLETAQRMEQAFPSLGDRLSTALAFALAPESAADSPSLRRRVVVDAHVALSSVASDRLLDRTRVWQALGILAGVAALILAVAGIAPAASGTALWRMFAPWADAPWPRLHHLAFVDPPRTHLADADLELVVRDERGRLPAIVELQFRFPDQAAQSKSIPAGIGDRLAVTLPAVSRSLEVRAVGGDDAHMRWHTIEVVEPARAEDLQVVVRPPEYTRRPPETTPGPIQAIAGSTVALSAKTDTAVQGAALIFETAGKETRFPVAVGPDRRTLRFPPPPAPGEPASVWQVTQSGSYWLELTAVGDETLSAESDRYAVRVAEDPPPNVRLAAPDSGLYATPRAKVPLTGVVTDNLAIARVELTYSRSDRSEEPDQRLPIFVGPDKAPQPSAGESAGQAEDRYSIRHDWDLATLPGLAPGAQLSLTVLASDYRPGESACTPRILKVVSSEQYAERLDERQAGLLAQVAQLREMQQQAREQTTAALVALETTDALDAAQRNRLQAADLTQRSIRQRLSGPDGLPGLVNQILADMSANRIERPETVERLSGLREVLRSIADETLPPTEQALVSGLKRAQQAWRDEPTANSQASAEVAAQLEVATAGQAEVLSELEHWLDDLRQWDDDRRLARDLRNLRRRQAEVREQAATLRGRTLGRSIADLTPEDQVELRVVAERQAELARETDRLDVRLQQAFDRDDPGDPKSARRADALAELRGQGVSGRMREASSEIRENRIGEATRKQAEAEAGLSDALDALGGQRERNRERRLERLRQASEDLERLRPEQERLRREAESAAEAAETAPERRMEDLARQQRAQAEKLERLARQVRRLRAESAGGKLQEAAEAAGSAADQAAASQPESAADAAREAERHLDQAADELAEARRQAERELAAEQVRQLPDVIAGLLERQQGARDQMQRLAQLEQAGELTAAQQKSLADLSVVERNLTSETARWSERLSTSPAFAEALRQAAGRMQRSADALVNRNLADADGEAEQAMERLRLVQDALAGPEPQPPQNGPPPAGGGDEPESPPGDEVPAARLADLILLKSLQESLWRRTRELDQVGRDRPLTDAEQSELAQLAREQQELSELLTRMLAKPDTAPQSPAREEAE